MATLTQLGSFGKALSSDRPPLCSGAISPPQKDSTFGTTRKTRGANDFFAPTMLHHELSFRRFIDFSSATPDDLGLLIAAREPATFGRGRGDVYDESYRQAVKMNASDFSIRLDLTTSGLVRTIEDRLLQGETENVRIMAELYRLNVYGDCCSSCPIYQGYLTL